MDWNRGRGCLADSWEGRAIAEPVNSDFCWVRSARPADGNLDIIAALKSRLCVASPRARAPAERRPARASAREVLVPRTHAQNCAYLIPTGCQFERPGGSMECSPKCCSPRGAESNLRPVLGLRRFSALDARPGGPARV